MAYTGKGFSVSSIIIISTIINNFQYVSSRLQPEELQEECWQLYPFTYSKCLKLCSPNSDATCLDDQLCFCGKLDTKLVENVSDESDELLTYNQHDMDQNLTPVPYLNSKFGTNALASCHFSDFCEELCKNDEKLVALFPTRVAIGVLCKILEEKDFFSNGTESCVCTISRA